MFRCRADESWKVRMALRDLWGPIDMSDPIHMGASPDRYELRVCDGWCVVVAVREVCGDA